jgi:hypothetical protein
MIALGQSGRPETVGEREKKMKKQFSATFEFQGIEYDYTAVICTGDDAYIYPDQITDLDRSDKRLLDEGIREDVEFAALQHAYLYDWCDQNGWVEEDIGNGNFMLSRKENGVTTRIVGAIEPVLPKSMGEPVVISKYDQNDRMVGKAVVLKGGINEWIADPSVSRWSPYADLIMEIAGNIGREKINPRWVEAFMSLEYPSLNSISRERFEREVKVAINCIDALGPEKAEQCAQSFGL